MALKPCKTCKKEVAHNAKTCPHCGVKDPGTTGKDVIMGLCIIAAVVAVIAVACTGEEKSSTPTTSSSAIISSTANATLGLTVSDFQQRFNSKAREVSASINANSLPLTSGTVNDTFNLSSGNGYVVGTVTKSGQIEGLLLGMGGGTGKQGESVDGIILLTLAANAVTSDTAPKDVGDAIGDLLQKSMADLDQPSATKHTTKVGNRIYTASANRTTGFMLTISAQ